MLISYNWLRQFFDKDLPSFSDISNLLTMHSFEVEGIEETKKDKIFNIDVLPNRNHDCLCHFGIAKEVSALANIPLKSEYDREQEIQVPESNTLELVIEEFKGCRRFSAIVVENIEVEESPSWLKERLESIGQRPINNIVDITNYVMFTVGQPLHAYDRELLKKGEGGYKLGVRTAKDGEKVKGLDDKEYSLTSDDMVIFDGISNEGIGVAGLKGGVATRITSKTKNIIIESANFDPVTIRKSSKGLKLRTDASVRFENEITPELTIKALKLAADLIVSMCSTAKVEGLSDWYPKRKRPYKVGVSVGYLNMILGTNLSNEEVEKILNRLNFKWEKVIPRQIIVEKAKELLEKPYFYGSSISYDAPEKFDCSSFAGYLYACAGIGLPRISIDQFAYGIEVNEADLKPGDLVFANSGVQKRGIRTETVEFMKGKQVPEGVDHVGVFVGEGKIIHASESFGKVVEEVLRDAKIFSKIVGYRTFDELKTERYVVVSPAERLDLKIEADLIEEIGRIKGYTSISSQKIKTGENKASINKNVFWTDTAREFLTSKGFSEIYGYAFSEEGEIELLNPIAKDRPFLRKDLTKGIKVNLELNLKNANLLGQEKIALFEIGMIYPKDGERQSICLGITGDKEKNIQEKVKEIVNELGGVLGINLNKFGETQNGIYEGDWSKIVSNLADPQEPHQYETINDLKFREYSQYPFVVRDVAVFVPNQISPTEVLKVIERNAGNLLVNIRIFDIFEKKEEELISYAWRLVFQSADKTLTDEEVNSYMDNVTKGLNSEKNWQVR